MILLELGSGDRPFEDGRGWVHNDEREIDHIEYVGDASNPSAWWEDIDSCDELRATHLLEHFSFRDTVEILTRWRSIIKPGGRLYLEVPNFSYQTRDACHEKTDRELVDLVYGSQDYEGNFHKAGFTDEILTEDLRAAGFSRIGVWDIGMVLVAEGWNDE